MTERLEKCAAGYELVQGVRTLVFYGTVILLVETRKIIMKYRATTFFFFNHTSGKKPKVWQSNNKPTSQAIFDVNLGFRQKDKGQWKLKGLDWPPETERRCGNRFYFHSKIIKCYLRGRRTRGIGAFTNRARTFFSVIWITDPHNRIPVGGLMDPNPHGKCVSGTRAEYLHPADQLEIYRYHPNIKQVPVGTVPVT